MEDLIKNSQLCEKLLHASRGRIQWKGPRSPPAAPGAVTQRTPRSTKRRLKRTRVRSRRPPFLGCRNSFCLLCFFAGGERRRQAGGSQSGEEELKKQNPLALHTAEYLCPLQKWDFTACSYSTSFFSPFFNATCSQVQLPCYQNTLKGGEKE